MNKLKYFVLAILVVASTSMNAATKRVLIEQFTGAWCGYCVDGTVKMDEILTQYPNVTIGVKFHNGDAMAIPETDIIGAALGLTGYPTGNVDRAAFNVGGTPRIMLDRGSWMSAVQAMLNQPAYVDLKLEWTYDESTQEIIASISGTFEQAINNEVRFNVYVIEDNVVGSGTGWDQANYYNNTVGHPYYQKGNPVKNYPHMAVVRATLGGPWGAANSIPQPVVSGMTAKYGFSIKKPANWKLENIKLVGMVANYTANSRQILNSVVGTKVKSTTTILQTGNSLDAAPVGSVAQLKLTLKNNGTSAKSYTFNFAKGSTTTWKATFEPNENSVSIPAGGTYEVTIKMPVENIGVGDATLLIEEAGGMTFSKSFKVYSSSGEFVSVNADPNMDEFVPNYIRTISTYKDMLSIPISDFNSIATKFTNLKVVNYNLGESGGFSATDIGIISSMINNKVNILFNGPLVYYYMSALNPSLFSQFGIGNAVRSFQGQTTNGRFSIAGIQNDPITDGFASDIGIYYYLFKVQITNNLIASPIVTLQGKPDTIYATKHIMNNGAKVVFFGFNPAGVANQNAMKQVIAKALNWMFNAPEPEYPKIATSVNTVAFGDVTISESSTKSFEITNTGKKDLSITSVKVIGGDAAAYQIIDPGKNLLKPNEATTVQVKFTPTANKFYNNAQIEIISNDPANPTITVALTGRGRTGTNVVDPSTVDLRVFPNPVLSNSTITFQIPETIKNTKVYVLDMEGRKVLDLGTYLSGMSSIVIDNKMLNAGSYLLVIDIDGEMLTAKFNVVK